MTRPTSLMPITSKPFATIARSFADGSAVGVAVDVALLVVPQAPPGAAGRPPWQLPAAPTGISRMPKPSGALKGPGGYAPLSSGWDIGLLMVCAGTSSTSLPVPDTMSLPEYA